MPVTRGLLALGVVLAACTTSASPELTPTPSPPVSAAPTTSEPLGVRVAVVLPPPGEQLLTTAGTRLAAEAVADRHDGALGEFRTVVADPGEFAGDLVLLLAERGYDLVCVVGDGAVEPVLAAARAFPAARFCAVAAVAAPPAEEVPDNALVVGLRMEEAAYLAGVAAAAAPTSGPEEAGDDDASPSPAPAGIVGDGSSPLTQRQREAFAAGLSAAGRADGPRISLSVTTDDELLAAVHDQFEAGVPVVFLPGGGPSDAALRTVADHEGSVIVHRDRARFQGATPPSVLVWFLLDVGVALDLAVAGVVGDWRSGVRSVGLVENAIRPQTGPAEGATTAFGRLREASDGVRDGTTSVPGP